MSGSRNGAPMPYIGRKVLAESEVFDRDRVWRAQTGRDVWPGPIQYSQAVYLRMQPSEGEDPFSVRGFAVGYAASPAGGVYDVAIRVDPRQSNSSGPTYSVAESVPASSLRLINGPDDESAGLSLDAIASAALTSCFPCLDDAFARSEVGANGAATGWNSHPEPTEAQKLAGNYRMGDIVVQGMPIRIENPRGTIRSGKSGSGKTWSNRMAAHYGYFAGTTGADGDAVDVFVGAYPESDRVWVVNQVIDGRFDETKVMMGFPDEESAVSAYQMSYDRGWRGLGSIYNVSVPQFRAWLYSDAARRAVSEKTFPSEGSPVMDKVQWVGDEPMGSTIAKVLYAVRAADADDGLLFDSLSMADIIDDSEQIAIFDALVIPYRALPRKVGQIERVMNAAGGDLTVLSSQVGEPLRRFGVAQVPVLFELSDGQTVTIFFHNPDSKPAKLAPTDEMVSWKWMLNKKDITIVVAPERGSDLNVREVARRVMKLADRNSAAFQKANTKRSERLQSIGMLKSELTLKQETLSGLERDIEIAEMEHEQRLAEPKPQMEVSDIVNVTLSTHGGLKRDGLVVRGIREIGAAGDKIYRFAMRELEGGVGPRLSSFEVAEHNIAAYEIVARGGMISSSSIEDAWTRDLMAARAEARAEALRPKFIVRQPEQLAYLGDSVILRMNHAQSLPGMPAAVYMDGSGKVAYADLNVKVVYREGDGVAEQGPPPELVPYFARWGNESSIIGLTSTLEKMMADSAGEMQALRDKDAAEKAQREQEQARSAEAFNALSLVLSQVKFKKGRAPVVNDKGTRTYVDAVLDPSGLLAVHKAFSGKGYTVSHVATGMKVTDFGNQSMAKLGAARFLMDADMSFREPAAVKGEGYKLLTQVVMATRKNGDALADPSLDAHLVASQIPANPSGYQDAKEAADSARARSKAAGEVMAGFPKGAMGLTPEDVRATPDWQAAKAETEAAFQAEREANEHLLKNFGDEARADRQADRDRKAEAATDSPPAADPSGQDGALEAPPDINPDDARIDEIIDGEANMDDPSLPDELEALYVKYQDDEVMQGRVSQAINALSTHLLAATATIDGVQTPAAKVEHLQEMPNGEVMESEQVAMPFEPIEVEQSSVVRPTEVLPAQGGGGAGSAPVEPVTTERATNATPIGPVAGVDISVGAGSESIPTEPNSQLPSQEPRAQRGPETVDPVAATPAGETPSDPGVMAVGSVAGEPYTAGELTKSGEIEQRKGMDQISGEDLRLTHDREPWSVMPVSLPASESLSTGIQGVASPLIAPDRTETVGVAMGAAATAHSLQRNKAGRLATISVPEGPGSASGASEPTAPVAPPAAEGSAMVGPVIEPARDRTGGWLPQPLVAPVLDSAGVQRRLDMICAVAWPKVPLELIMDAVGYEFDSSESRSQWVGQAQPEEGELVIGAGESSPAVTVRWEKAAGDRYSIRALIG